MHYTYPHSYSRSRDLFIAASTASGGSCRTIGHPLPGPDGELLATDLAYFGDADAKRVLIVVSATHGVEGICGSGGQLALLASGLPRQFAPNVATLFVHALNPHGFAYLRRTTEDNIDLNRNFLDHRGGNYPDDAAYAEVHSMVVPGDWDGPEREAAEARIAEFIARRGLRELQTAVCRGQYSFPNGLFFGGRHEAWSNRVFRRILREYAGQARYVGVIDLHSGLGARGACEIISGAVKDSLEHRLARILFGEAISFPSLNALVPPASGYMGSALENTIPRAAGALVVAEFGTEPFDQVLDALRADNWLHAYGGRSSPYWARIKTQMRHAFACDDATWARDVAERTIELYRGAASALGGSLDDALALPGGAPLS